MKEQWNLEKRLQSSVPKTEIPEWIFPLIEEQMNAPINALEECKKSESERAVHNAVNEALGAEMDDLQLPSIPIDESRVHIIDPEVYSANPKLSGGRGMMLNGHIYLQRTESIPRLLRDSTHEYVHAASFRVILAQYWREQQGDKISHQTSTHERRSGISFQALVQGRLREIQFNGFNEAVTEMLALELRKRIINGCAIQLSDDDKKAASIFSYPHPVVLQRILKTISSPEHPVREWKSRLYQDLFRGTYGSIKAMDRTWHDIRGTRLSPTIRCMDTSDLSAIKTAYALGFEDLAKNIEKQRASNK